VGPGRPVAGVHVTARSSEANRIARCGSAVTRAARLPPGPTLPAGPSQADRAGDHRYRVNSSSAGSRNCDGSMSCRAWPPVAGPPVPAAGALHQRGRQQRGDDGGVATGAAIRARAMFLLKLPAHAKAVDEAAARKEFARTRTCNPGHTRLSPHPDARAHSGSGTTAAAACRSSSAWRVAN